MLTNWFSFLQSLLTQQLLLSLSTSLDFFFFIQLYHGRHVPNTFYTFTPSIFIFIPQPNVFFIHTFLFYTPCLFWLSNSPFFLYPHTLALWTPLKSSPTTVWWAYNSDIFKVSPNCKNGYMAGKGRQCLRTEKQRVKVLGTEKKKKRKKKNQRAEWRWEDQMFYHQFFIPFIPNHSDKHH